MNNKILILANNDVGLYNFRFELIDTLIKEGYKVHIALPYGRRVDVLIKFGCIFHQVELERHGKNPIKDAKLINTYRKLINEIKPICILSYTVKPNIYGAFASKKYATPFFANVTGLGTAIIGGGITQKILLNMYKVALKYTDTVFFQNKNNQDFFISNNIVNADKTKLLPGSGVNVNKFIPIQKDSNSIVKFIFIGRLMKDKGIEEYLEACMKILSKYPNTEFQILGSFEESKYKQHIQNINNKKIKYLGVSSDVRKEISSADCIVHPSYHEGMSNVLLEGAAMGKPLLASNIPGCKEIIDDGKNGFLFEPKSAKDLEKKIIKFINLTDEERDNMGRASREKVVREFDREIIVNEYMKVIDTISMEK